MNKLIVRWLSAFIPGKDKRRDFRARHLVERYTDTQNHVILVDGAGKEHPRRKGVPGLHISFEQCVGCTVRVHEQCTFTNCQIHLERSRNCDINIAGGRLKNLHIASLDGHSASLRWGAKSTCHGVCIYLNEPGTRVIIGEDCMFSSGIHIWPTDGHAILDQTTQQPINSIKHPLCIGDHCWIGQNVSLLKNAIVPEGCVVAHSSVVTREFTQNNCILAGAPARVIKDNISWVRPSPAIYQEESSSCPKCPSSPQHESV